MEAGESFLRAQVQPVRLAVWKGPQLSVCWARLPALGAAQPGTWGRGARTDGLGAGARPCRSSWACGVVGLLSHGHRVVEAGRSVSGCPAGTLGFVSRCVWACKAWLPCVPPGAPPYLSRARWGVYRAGVGEQTPAPCGPDSDRLWPQISVAPRLAATTLPRLPAPPWG